MLIGDQLDVIVSSFYPDGEDDDRFSPSCRVWALVWVHGYPDEDRGWIDLALWRRLLFRHPRVHPEIAPFYSTAGQDCGLVAFSAVI